MKQKLSLDYVSCYFSNSAEGFDLVVEDNEDNRIALQLRPWGHLADFTSAVIDYSIANGLTEVPDAKLSVLRKVLNQAIQAVEKQTRIK
jgi:hypothetical protein